MVLILKEITGFIINFFFWLQFPEVLQYRVNAQKRWSKLLFHLSVPKIHLIYCPWIEDISDIKLIRTATKLILAKRSRRDISFIFNKEKTFFHKKTQINQIKNCEHFSDLSFAFLVYLQLGSVSGSFLQQLKINTGRQWR